MSFAFSGALDKAVMAEVTLLQLRILYQDAHQQAASTHNTLC